MARPGRPKISPLTRAEQLRRAKRAQREREREAGLVDVQLRLPRMLADRLAVARRARDFEARLESLLDRAVVRIADYPQLRDLAWNRVDEYLPAREAFQLYERNWRLVEVDRLEPCERALIDRLKNEFGDGVINA